MRTRSALLLSGVLTAGLAAAQVPFPSFAFPAKADGGHIIYSKLVPARLAAGGLTADTIVSKLHIMNGDGTSSQPFITSPDLSQFKEPRWSPSFDRLAFASTWLNSRSACMTDIFEARIDGAVRRVTGNELVGKAPLGYGSATGRVDPQFKDDPTVAYHGDQISVTAQGMDGVVIHPAADNSFKLPKVAAGDTVWVKTWVTERLATLSLIKVQPGQTTDMGTVKLNEGAFSANKPSLAIGGQHVVGMGGLTQVALSNNPLEPVLGEPASSKQKTIGGAESICVYDGKTGALSASIDLGKLGFELAKEPAISPDGTVIACAWGKMTQENLSLLPMASVLANAPAPKVLVPGQMLMFQPGAPMIGCGGPCWSPDGKQLAFARTIVVGDGSCGAGIWVVGADGSGLREVASLGLGRICCQPCFSPDGKRVAFTAITGKFGPLKVEQVIGGQFTLDIQVVDLASGKLTALTSDGASCEPAWGP